MRQGTRRLSHSAGLGALPILYAAAPAAPGCMNCAARDGRVAKQPRQVSEALTGSTFPHGLTRPGLRPSAHCPR